MQAITDLTPEAYTIDQSVHIAGIGRSTLYEAMGAGELPSVRIGRRRLILRTDLLAWLQSHRDQGPNDGPVAE
jgi:excisionase family DNA binding protein